MPDPKKTTRKPKPIMDVAHPNKSAPSGNSKSVIITHRDRVQDPMVVKDAVEPTPATTADDAAVQAKTSATKTGGERTLQPLTAPLLKPVKAAETHEDVAVEPDEPKASETPEKADETAKPDVASESENTESEEDSTTEEKAEADADAEKNDDTNPQADLIADEADQKAEAALQKLVEEKKYFLPINSLEKRRTKRVIALGVLLSLVLILAWADIALDAGLVKVDGVKPVTHFFSS